MQLECILFCRHHRFMSQKASDFHFLNPEYSFFTYSCFFQQTGVAVKIAKKPKNANRGGVLLVNLEAEYVSASQEPNLEVKLVGGLSGFKAGKTVRAIFTHFADIGAVKNAVVSWVPAPPNLAVLLSPSTSPSVFIQALKVYPMSFA